ncbi:MULTISPECIES: transcriptional regulator BetI [Spiribacter]|uniref:transcriptional regulator BetI n=1 Tax=Spiribacter TaxID=1335745 RepID=UPI001330E0CB|nr:MULTISPECIES: transcriptional regulator BetI [Spiribacter]KAF0281751.1 transcriptional regulator BetI [Spiribacter roseus]KAF0284574.1 transcriptional regulator BetI [Spiribacter roseus]KAF0286587.1 transcriptional regulator BetI [Spiribacter sp. SSL99]
MARKGMETVRRRQLIQATLQVIHDQGLQATTLGRVGQQAGISPGLVAHYFGDKRHLLASTYLSLVRSLEQEYRAARAGTAAGLPRVRAIIDANFAASQSDAVTVSCWLSFWAQVNHVPSIARIQRVVTRRLESNLTHALAAFLPRAEAVRLAEGLGVMIDGLWLRASLRTGGLDVAAARALAHRYLDSELHALTGGPHVQTA